jgi:hypothetical protein
LMPVRSVLVARSTVTLALHASHSIKQREVPRPSMPRWKPSPLFSEPQLAQLQDTIASLRELNDAARRQLKYVAECYLTTRQYGQAGESFSILAMRIRSVLKRREQVRFLAFHNSINPKVVVRTRCRNCDDLREELDAGRPESQKVDAQHIDEIDRLLELAQHTEAARDRLSPQNSSLGSVDSKVP